MIVASDLEGVLIPEIWQEIADHYGIPELQKTTRESADFTRLMDHRIEVLQAEGLTLADLQDAARNVMAYPGSHEFLDWCSRHGQVFIISDTFHELSDDLVSGLGGYNLFANRFQIDEEGYITGYDLRIRGRKWRVLERLREIGYFVAAVGDSYNDISMLEQADLPIFYNPPEELRKKYPDVRALENYAEVKEALIRREELANPNSANGNSASEVPL